MKKTIMIVKENLISFRVLWAGNYGRVVDTQRTRELVSLWLVNQEEDVRLELCGASMDGPIDLVFESIGNKNKTKYLIELITMFRKNTEVERIWLKWNDITDDFIWTDKEAKIEMNKKEYEKKDYILIHKK